MKKIEFYEGESWTIGLRIIGIAAADIQALEMSMRETNGLDYKKFKRSDGTITQDVNDPQVFRIQFSDTQKPSVGKFQIAVKTAALGIRKTKEPLTYEVLTATSRQPSSNVVSASYNQIFDITITTEVIVSNVFYTNLLRARTNYEIAVDNGFVGTETQWLATFSVPRDEAIAAQEAAEASAADALASKNTATTKANEAATSAADALTSKNTATTNAIASATSAADALTSKNTATTKANEAATSAADALTSKNTATAKATEAAQSALDAASSAANALANAPNIMFVKQTVSPVGVAGKTTVWADSVGALFMRVDTGTAKKIPMLDADQSWTGSNTYSLALRAPELTSSAGNLLIRTIFNGGNNGEVQIQAGAVQLQSTSANTILFRGGTNQNTVIRGYNDTYSIVLQPSGGNILVGAMIDNGNKLQINGSTNITNNLGIATTAPTHSLTFGSTSTGWTHYNTADQTTNFERVRSYWSGNTYVIGNEKSGSGTQRNLRLSVGSNTELEFSSGAFQQFGLMNLIANLGGGPGNSFSLIGTNASNSGIGSVIAIHSTINQSGTAGYRGIFVSPFEQATGSGSKLLLDLGTNSAANGAGTHTSRFNVDNTGNVLISNGTNSSRISIVNGRLAISRPDLPTVESISFGGGNTEVSIRGGLGSLRHSGTDFSIDAVSSSNLLLVSTAGYVQMGIPSGGIRVFPSTANVGIGTTTDAGFKLDVNGTARVQGAFSTTGITSIVGTRPGDNSGQLVIGTAGQAGYISFARNAAGSLQGGIGYLTAASDGDFKIVSAGGSGNITFTVAIGDAMRIFTTGNVLIGTTTDVASSILTLSSTTKGFLPPRMTTAQINAIPSPANGLVAYNTTLNALCVFDGTAWKKMTVSAM